MSVYRDNTDNVATHVQTEINNLYIQLRKTTIYQSKDQHTMRIWYDRDRHHPQKTVICLFKNKDIQT